MLALRILVTIFCAISILTKLTFMTGNDDENPAIFYVILSMLAHIFMIVAIWVI